VFSQSIIGGEVESRALEPDTSPWPQCNSWRRCGSEKQAVPTRLFALEVLTLAALWENPLGFCLCLPDPLPAPMEVRQFSLVVPAAVKRGHPFAPVLGLALLSPTCLADATAASALTMADPTPPSMRALLRAAGQAGEAHLLSSIRWRSEGSTVTFFLPRARFAQLRDQGYHAVLIRTDSWSAVTEALPLVKAVDLGHGRASHAQ
jgi:hypothetical protein